MGWLIAWTRLFHFFALHRGEFLTHYHKRCNVENAFSAIERVFGDPARSRTPRAQLNEVPLKIICHNIRCLIHEAHELGIMPTLERLPCPCQPKFPFTSYTGGIILLVVAKVRLSGYRCERCGHEWVPRDKDQEPRVCPKCKSPYWNTPRRTEKSKAIEKRKLA